MFTITTSAKFELQKRLSEQSTTKWIRLQMRNSCLMKLKLTLEESVLANDKEVEIDGLRFIVDKNQYHYFTNRTIDYLPDQTGFMQFEAV